MDSLIASRLAAALAALSPAPKTAPVPAASRTVSEETYLRESAPAPLNIARAQYDAEVSAMLAEAEADRKASVARVVSASEAPAPVAQTLRYSRKPKAEPKRKGAGVYVSLAVPPDMVRDGETCGEDGRPLALAKDWTAGLAVVRFEGKWQVCHRPSGIKCADARNRPHACKIMEALDPLSDWTLDAESATAGDVVERAREAIEACEAPEKRTRPAPGSRAWVEAMVAPGQPWEGAEIEAIERGIGSTEYAWELWHPSGARAIVYSTGAEVGPYLPETLARIEGEASPVVSVNANEVRKVA